MRTRGAFSVFDPRMGCAALLGATECGEVWKLCDVSKWLEGNGDVRYCYGGPEMLLPRHARVNETPQSTTLNRIKTTSDHCPIHVGNAGRMSAKIRTAWIPYDRT